MTSLEQLLVSLCCRYLFLITVVYLCRTVWKFFFFFVLTYLCNHLPVSHFYAHLWYHFADSWIDLNRKSHYAWCLASHIAYTRFWMSVSFLVNTHFATITSHLLYATIHHGSCQVKKNTSLFPLCYPATFTKRPGRMAHSIALFIEINQAHLSFTQSHKTHLTFLWFPECQSEQQPCPPLCCCTHALKDFESV